MALVVTSLSLPADRCNKFLCSARARDAIFQKRTIAFSRARTKMTIIIIRYTRTLTRTYTTVPCRLHRCTCKVHRWVLHGNNLLHPKRNNAFLRVFKILRIRTKRKRLLSRSTYTLRFYSYFIVKIYIYIFK